MNIHIASQTRDFFPTRFCQQVVLAGLLALSSTGCGSGATSGIAPVTSPVTSQPTQPTTPVVPPGWVNVDRPYASFSYPTGWKLTESTSGGQVYVIATDPALQHQVLVQFVQGFVNQADTFDQCAGVNKVLTDFYTANFLSIATDPMKYPQTSVTKTGPTIGGSLGGSVLEVSVVTAISSGSALGGYTFELQGAPRAEGLYLVGIRNPDYYATPSFEKTFLGTLVLKATALPHGANCNYLG